MSAESQVEAATVQDGRSTARVWLRCAVSAAGDSSLPSLRRTLESKRPPLAPEFAAT